MKTSIRAVLRNAQGEHMRTLTTDEIDWYARLADEGRVLASKRTKKGRPCWIFKLKPEAPPAPEPSKSPDSSTSLTLNDMEGLAGLLGPVSRRLRERWIGYGLLSEPA